MTLKAIFYRRWDTKERILLLERLHLYVSAGLLLDKTVQTICEGFTARQSGHRLSMELVLADIRSGGSLADSLKRNVGLPDAMIGLIAHGEASGELAKTLRSAHTHMERRQDLKSKVLSALTYPIVIGLFASGMTVGLVRGVMPQIIPMLESLHVPLPLLTRMVMRSSAFLISYGPYSMIGLIVAAILGRIAYKRSTLVQRAAHRLVSLVPIVGSLVREYSLSVFLRSFGSLIESGLPVGSAYDRASQTVTFGPIKAFLRSKRSAVSQGSPLGSAFRGGPMPPHVAPLLSAGEASGMLGSSIIRAADILDRDIEHSLKRLTSLVEPAMMAGMGLVVGAIAVSIMMPIYDISKSLK